MRQTTKMVSTPTINVIILHNGGILPLPFYESKSYLTNDFGCVLGPAEHIGSGYVMPEHFKSTEGRVKKPIISKKFQPIGQFVIDYLVITAIKEREDPSLNTFSANNDDPKEVTFKSPTTSSETKSNKDSTKCNFKVTYAKHWKSDWKGLEVAHRGLGNSYTKAQK